MSFAAPIWLWGILPWSGLALWLLWGLRRGVSVPFLDLWRGPVEDQRVRRWVQPPPLALVAVLGAVLLGIIGAARPMASRGGRNGETLTIVIDRGITMSAEGVDGKRYSRTIEQARSAILEAYGPARVELVGVPQGGRQQTDTQHWSGRALALPKTAVNTRDAMERAIAAARAAGKQPIIVISDQALDGGRAPVIQIVADESLQNIGIVRVAARPAPELGSGGQVMVRLRNQSAATTAELAIGAPWANSGPASWRAIALPAGGAARDYFEDVAALGPVVQVQIKGADDGLAADSIAWLVRQSAWPRIGVETTLPPALQRFVQVYRRQRPASGDSRSVVLAADAAQLGGRSGVIVPQAESGDPIRGEPAVVPHAITGHVDWGTVLGDAQLESSVLAGSGWRSVMTIGGRTALAERQMADGGRQVWVGFASASFAKRPSYVIFWTDVLDWVGQGAPPTYAWQPVHDPGDAWRRIAGPPGVADAGGLEAGLWQRRSDGALMATDALDVRIGPIGLGDWRGRLAALARAQRTLESRQLGPVMALLALGGLVAGAVLWPARRHGAGRRAGGVA